MVIFCMNGSLPQSPASLADHDALAESAHSVRASITPGHNSPAEFERRSTPICHHKNTLPGGVRTQ